MISHFLLQVRGLGLFFLPEESQLKQTLSAQFPPFVQTIRGNPSQWLPRLLQIIDLPEWKENPWDVRLVSFSPDGQTMVVAQPGRLTLLDVRTGISKQQVRTDQHLPGDGIIVLASAEDGNRVNSISVTGKLQVWEMDTHTCTTRCELRHRCQPHLHLNMLTSRNVSH